MLNGYVGTEGKQFYMSLRWNDTDPYKPRHVLVSTIIIAIIILFWSCLLYDTYTSTTAVYDSAHTCNICCDIVIRCINHANRKDNSMQKPQESTQPCNPTILIIWSQASKVSLSVKNMESSVEEVSALNYFNKLAEDYFGDKAFIWSVNFRSWETSGIIQMELYTNMGLAFAAVLIVTLFLVANIWACILVCLCVIITLVSVCIIQHIQY